MREKVTPEAERNACEHVFCMLDVAEHRITFLLLAIALLSLVQSKMIQLGEFFKGIFCLVAQTQSGKTTLSALFLDFISGTKADANFDSTAAAITRSIGNKRDAPVLIDDYKPTTSRSARNAQMLILDRIIRICSDDSHGYQRAGAGNSTIVNKALCIVAITAEQVCLQVQSTLARLLIAEMTRKSVDWDKMTFFQNNHNIYRFFVENYILYISALGVDEYCENLRTRFLRERGSLRTKSMVKNILVDNRTSDMCTWLHIAFDEFLKYALAVGAINQELLESYRKESLTIILNLMETQAERMDELDDTGSFFKGLRYILDTKEVQIEPLRARNNGFEATGSKAAVGFRKNGLVYLKNNVAYQSVVSHFKRFGKEFPASETTLRKRFVENGFLTSKSPKQVIHRLTVNGERYQCIAFAEETFNHLLGGNHNEYENASELSNHRLLCANANGILGRGN